jgi:hypothetical protein
MNAQFLKKVCSLTQSFTTDLHPEHREWHEGEYTWVVRKRILDDEFVEYYVAQSSRISHKMFSAFVYVDGEEEWRIEAVR